MENKRDYSLDFFKGIAILSIVFIHTVWWTGQSYVPNIVAQISLLIDVPLFFFLSGASATFAFKKQNPFAGIIRLWILFILYNIVYTAITEPFHLTKHFVDSLFMSYPNTPKLFVVFGSAWFISKFVVVYILGFITVKNLPNKVVLPMFCLLLLFGIYKYPNVGFLNSLSLFSINSDYIMFYLFLFLIGYYYYNNLRSWKWIRMFSIGLFTMSLIMLLTYFNDKPFNLQDLKFDPKFYYLIASFLSISLVIYLSKYIKNNSFISKIGENALSYYLAQGISSTLIQELVNALQMHWAIKLLIVFSANVLGTIVIAQVIIYLLNNYFKATKYLFQRLENIPLLLKKGNKKG